MLKRANPRKSDKFLGSRHSRVHYQVSPWHSLLQSFFFNVIIKSKLPAAIQPIWAWSNGLKLAWKTKSPHHH